MRLASDPTARTLPVFLEIATTEGSLQTIPLPLTYTRVFAVPRSMAMSFENQPMMVLMNIVRRCSFQLPDRAPSQARARQKSNADPDGPQASNLSRVLRFLRCGVRACAGLPVGRPLRPG